MFRHMKIAIACNDQKLCETIFRAKFQIILKYSGKHSKHSQLSQVLKSILKVLFTKTIRTRHEGEHSIAYLTTTHNLWIAEDLNASFIYQFIE